MMLAARGAFLAARRNRAPTAKSYVQDGLIAMWDGNENAGWGIHTSGTARWENLVDPNCYATGDKMSGSAAPVFDDNSAVFNKNCFYIANASRLNGAKFMEFVFRADSDNYGSSYLGELSNSGIAFTPYGVALLKSGTGNGATITGGLSKGVVYTYSIDFSVLTGAVPYVNGAAVGYSRSGNVGRMSYSAIGRGGWGNWYYKGKIFCVRIYNRSITAAELAANREFDKERFNLP